MHLVSVTMQSILTSQMLSQSCVMIDDIERSQMCCCWGNICRHDNNPVADLGERPRGPPLPPYLSKGETAVCECF